MTNLSTALVVANDPGASGGEVEAPPLRLSSERSLEIVGRQAELTAIHGFLHHLRSGMLALIFGGEPGIGKTALWSQAVADAGSLSYRILTCRPVEAEMKLSFAALSDLLEGVDEAHLAELREPQRHALEVALLRRAVGDAIDRRAVSAAFLEVLKRLSRERPVLIAVDDIQWIDAPSLGALEFALRRLDKQPIGLLTTARIGTDDGSELSLLKAIPEERAQLRMLGPLPDEAVRQLVVERFGGSLVRSAIFKLVQTSGGNPFFALEIARALLRRETQSPVVAPPPLPHTLKCLVADTVRALPAPAQEALAAASMVSEPTVGAVNAALRQNKGLALKVALDEEVIAIDGERIRFSHPLLASAAYSQLPAARRRLLHRRLANVVSCPEERAWHLVLGTAGVDERVASVLDEAAKAASLRGAPVSAAELTELAAVRTPPDRLADKSRRNLEAAEYYLQAGNRTRAEKILQQLVVSSPDDSAYPKALVLLGEGAHDPSNAIRLLKDALGRVGDDASITIRILDALVDRSIAAGDIQAGARYAEAQLERSEGFGGHQACAPALISSAYAEFLLGRGLRQDLIDRAERLSISSRDLFTGARMQLATGPPEACRDRFERLLRRLEERGEENWSSPVLLELAELEYRAGNWALAAGYAEEAHSLAVRTGWRCLSGKALSTKARVRAGLGQLEPARAEALEALAILGGAGQQLDVALYPLPVLGFIELSAGDLEACHERLHPLLEGCNAMGLREPALLRFVADDVEALVGLGRLEDAASALEPFDERARRLDRASAIALALRCRGFLLAAGGEVESGICVLKEALGQHDRVREPLEVARTQLRLGEVQRRAKQRREAKRSLELALAQFEQLGAAGWAQRARSELARIGGRAPAPLELTPTERQVAELVAAGHSNPEVAHALFMSRKTVEANLTRIYAKLDVRSRTALARLLAEEAKG